MPEATSDTATIQPACPVCMAATSLLDVVDLNKSCEEDRGRFLPKAGIPIQYTLCDQCGFCFAPEMYQWSVAEFSARIYNEDYKIVDPDCVTVRPHQQAQMLTGMFARHVLEIRHLDFGGGNGELSNELFAQGWDSTSYDPLVDGPLRDDLGKFNLITSFEVFEHVPDVNHLISTLSSLVEDDGMVLFSTFVSDGHIARNQPLRWWYASPRNGHISLFSRHSLRLLGEKANFRCVNRSAYLHAFWREMPSWAADVFKPA